MPYIKTENRDHLEVEACEYGQANPRNCGELNYEITLLLKRYLQRKGACYQTYNDIIGALECAKLEIYRRKVIPYEDKKKLENGDVY